jgi:hypothetical protein
MRKSIFAVVMLSVVIALPSCEKGEKDTRVVATIGAQSNTTTGGFYSVSKNKVYTQAEAFADQASVDILCFYEAEGGNNVALASPGSGITGIFTGDSAPENWTEQNTTWLLNTALTAAQFDALAETDQIIVSSFIEADARRKAKDMQPGLVVSFKTEAGTYGLLKVTEVTQGASGSVKFEVKVKK